MLPLNLKTGEPFYRQIVDQITQLAGSGQLEAGARLPSVRELAAQLTVSLITIRKAYDELENAGLIERRQGQGTFVVDNVEVASRKSSRRQAYRILIEALTKARQLGLGDAELRTFVAHFLDRPIDRPQRY